ncbi:MAG: LicD family protein [Eubacteriaceae bacterium]|nr:LicD family protein [Eubacteriaceae bacterium]
MEAGLRAIQLKSLEIYEVFSAFCSRCGLTHFFCGGALIGAARTGGFIPWDDDIDVFMMRGDYEKLLPLWKGQQENGRYSMLRTSASEFCDTMLTQFSDNRTTFVKEGLKDSDINHGLKLEIIPLDAAPPTKLGRWAQIFWALVFCLYNRGAPPEHRGPFARVCGKTLLWLVPSYSMRCKIWRFAERRMSKAPITECTQFYTELCVTYKYMKNLYPASIFSSVAYLSFEGLTVPVPAGWKEYLSIAFGDYMSLPPDTERIAKHPASYVDLDRPYFELRGVAYLEGKA